MIPNDHYLGFEDAKTMHDMLDQFSRWRDVIQLFGDDFYRKAFNRRPCHRTLRYIGFTNWPEPDRTAESDEFFVVGEMYRSTSFNGATYTIENYHGGRKTIGFLYFNWIGDDRTQTI